MEKTQRHGLGTLNDLDYWQKDFDKHYKVAPGTDLTKLNADPNNVVREYYNHTDHTFELISTHPLKLQHPMGNQAVQLEDGRQFITHFHRIILKPKSWVVAPHGYWQLWQGGKVCTDVVQFTTNHGSAIGIGKKHPDRPDQPKIGVSRVR